VHGAEPLDTELETTGRRDTLIKDALDGVLRLGASRERPGIIIRV
jgi:hypothetical protein